MAADQPELVIVTGDLIYGGPATPAAFQDWKAAMAPLYNAGIPVYPVRGNHDRGTGWEAEFGPDIPDNGPAGEIDMTYFVTNRNALFVALDQYVVSHRNNQPWLDGVLASNTLPHVFTFGHEPAFKIAHHYDCLDDAPVQRDIFWQSLVNAHSLAYFCGHDHYYDSTIVHDNDDNPGNDISHHVVGCTGAPFYTDEPNYDGDNGAWLPENLYHEVENGYLLGEVDGTRVTLTFRRRDAVNVYSSAYVYTYELLDSFAVVNPDPADRSTNVVLDVQLAWQESADSQSYEVYMGTDMASVSNATPGSPEHLGNLTTNVVDPGALTFETTYFWRVDANAAIGTATGRVWRFETFPERPVIADPDTISKQDAGVEITFNSATLTGTLVSEGAAPCEARVYWGTVNGGTNAATWGHTNDLESVQEGPLSELVTNLLADTAYFYRYYAENVHGGAWAGNSTSFSTWPRTPVIENDDTSRITTQSARLNGNLVYTGAAPAKVWVYWGADDGVDDKLAWDTGIPLGEHTNGAVWGECSGLEAGRQYYLPVLRHERLRRRLGAVQREFQFVA